MCVIIDVTAGFCCENLAKSAKNKIDTLYMPL